MWRFQLFALLMIGLICTGCEKETGWEKEQRILTGWLLEHDISTPATASGLYYIETFRGSGPDADAGDEVRVKYRGYLLDGTVFDSGIFKFVLGRGQVIRGWDEGINYMKEGSKATLIIPSSIGYGAYGTSGIPGYSTLVFDVEVLDVY